MRGSKMKKFFMILGIALAATLVFGLLVMALWNAILPVVIGVKTITFWQALGILLLSKILFGGFGRGGGFGRRRREWKERMEQKLGAMTTEEREKFKAEWKNRCGGMHWQPFRKDTAASE